MEKAVALNSGGTTPCIIGSFAPFPGQLINKAVIKHRITRLLNGHEAVLVNKIKVNGTPEKIEI